MLYRHHKAAFHSCTKLFHWIQLCYMSAVGVVPCDVAAACYSVQWPLELWQTTDISYWSAVSVSGWIAPLISSSLWQGIVPDKWKILKVAICSKAFFMFSLKFNPLQSPVGLCRVTRVTRVLDSKLESSNFFLLEYSPRIFNINK